LFVTAIGLIVLWAILRCCTREITKEVRQKNAAQVDEKNRETAMKVYSNAVEKKVSNSDMMKNLDRNRIKASLKKGTATREGFANTTAVKDGEIELSSNVNVDAIDVDVQIQVEADVTVEIDVPEVKVEASVNTKLVKDSESDDSDDEEVVQQKKARKAITYMVFTITRTLLFLAFTCLAFIPPIFSGFYIIPWWAAILATFFIFVLAISFDKSSKSSNKTCCSRLCHCCQAFNEFKLEAYLVIFISLI